jgi:hypothetical protein
MEYVYGRKFYAGKKYCRVSGAWCDGVIERRSEMGCEGYYCKYFEEDIDVTSMMSDGRKLLRLPQCIKRAKEVKRR